MPILYNDGRIATTKKEDGKLKIRIDAEEFALKDGVLFIGCKTKGELGDIYIPNDSEFKFPGVACITLDEAQEGQKFIKTQLSETLESGKVYRGWVSVDDTLEMAKKANAGSETHVNVLLEESFTLTEQPEPEILTDLASLSAPAAKGGKGRTYDPMAKFNALKAVTGLEGTVQEISAKLNELDADTLTTTLALLEMVV